MTGTLVVAPNWVGDTVMALPVLVALAAAYWLYQQNEQLVSEVRTIDAAARTRFETLDSHEAIESLNERTRLLAERGMFLGTRLPQMTGLFADVWASRLLASNPEVKQMLTDVHTFAVVSERLANSTDELSNHITAERKATVDQVMKEVSELRELTIDQVMKRVSIERELAIESGLEFSGEDQFHDLCKIALCAHR